MVNGFQVFAFGSVPLKTYLPDGDIDLTALCHPVMEDQFAKSIYSILEGAEQDTEFRVIDVQYVRAQVIMFCPSTHLFCSNKKKVNWLIFTWTYVLCLSVSICDTFLHSLVSDDLPVGYLCLNIINCSYCSHRTALLTFISLV